MTKTGLKKQMSISLAAPASELGGSAEMRRLKRVFAASLRIILLLYFAK